MKKFLIVFFIILIIAGAVAAFFIFKNKPSIAIPDNSASKICQQIGEIGKGNDSIVNYCLGIVNKDEKYCQKTGGEDKNICLAIVKNDQSYCQKISKPEAQKTCYLELSQRSNNINVCDQLSGDKENCYLSFISGLFWDSQSPAFKNISMNSQWCSQFGSDSPESKTCQALVKNDQSLCGQNETCLSFFKQDLSFCDKGNLDKNKGDCLRDRALSSQDSTICAKISDQKGQDDCYLDYSGHVEPNTSYCDKIKGDASNKIGCYIEVASHYNL